MDSQSSGDSLALTMSVSANELDSGVFPMDCKAEIAEAKATLGTSTWGQSVDSMLRKMVVGFVLANLATWQTRPQEAPKQAAARASGLAKASAHDKPMK